MRNKFLVREVDEFDNSYFEVDTREFIKKALRLPITSAKTFDRIIEVFEEADINKINKINTFLDDL